MFRVRKIFHIVGGRDELSTQWVYTLTSYFILSSKSRFSGKADMVKGNPLVETTVSDSKRKKQIYAMTRICHPQGAVTTGTNCS